MTWRWLSFALPLVFLSGCYIDQLPDPNAVQGTAKVNPEVMQRNIAALYVDLDLRVKRGEITEVEKQKKIKELVDTITSYIKPEEITDDEAWRFADLFRQAGDLDNAQMLYERAVAHAKTEDRRVNDTLQLARVMAMKGDVKGAVATAEKTFDAPPTEKAPILMSALYEIVPVGLGKGDDLELADFLEKAIGQHLMVEVNQNSEAGEAFLSTMQIHVGKAWEQVLRIYANAGKDDLLRAAIERRDKSSDKLGKI